MGKKAKRPIKVLHAPLNYANQAYVLSQALRARGIDSHLLRYQWQANTAVRFYQEEDRIAEISRDDWFGDLLRNVQNIAGERFDIVHFWNRTLLWRRPTDFFNAMDLPFIRLAGTRLAYRFTGYELRRKSLELEVNPFAPHRYGYQSPFNEDDQNRYLDYLARYIDAFVVQDPEMQTYCPQSRIIPRALDLAQFPIPEPARNKRPLVVHAPSHRKLKGSEFVTHAVDVLKEEGLDFDFLLIENMPNAEALALYRRADIVIDQLLVGWYGVLSMEAMAMGKTVIAYIRNDLKSYFRHGMPLVNANPETITATLREAIKDGELRREIGRRARAFIEDVHDSRVVARSAAKLYKKILRTPTSLMVPDFSYQLGNSADFVRTLNAASRASSLQRKLNALETTYNSLKTTHAADENEARKITVLTEEITELRDKAERYDELGPQLRTLGTKAERYDELETELLELREKAARYDELRPELPALRDKVRLYDELRQELPALRHDAQRYTELKTELPALRYKSKRYEDLKDVAPVWHAKADRFDRLASKRWVRFVFPLFGLSLASKSQRKPRPTGRKPKAVGHGAARAGTGSVAGEAGEGEPVNRSAAGATRPPTASPSIIQQRASGFDSKGLACIVTRKPIGNVSRAPRMAKALVDAGYGVVVLSLRVPVPQLREMCPEVEYIEFPIRPFTIGLRYRWEQRRRRRIAARTKRDEDFRAALAKGGLRGVILKARSRAGLPWRSLAGLCWRVLVAVPCALLLKKTSGGFVGTWRELADEDAIQIAIRFVMILHSWASSYALAEEADKATRGRRFDVVQAYDNFALVAAARLAGRDRAKLIYDAVELASDRLALAPNIVERIGERLERRQETGIIRKSNAVLTVSDGLADWYARHCRIRRPLVVRNCRYYWPYQADGRLRADAGVSSSVRLLVWCGFAYPQQGIEILVNALPRLAPHIHVAIVAYSPPSSSSYVQEVLPALVASLGVGDRVHFLPAREPNDVVPYISGADLGVIPRSREQLNNFFSMPNKFLEMVMARLPIAVSQLGDMVDLLGKYDMGGVFDERDPANIAAVIEGMLEPLTYARLKSNVMKAAEILSWERESLPYANLVGSLMPTERRPVNRQISAPGGSGAERVRVIAEVWAILKMGRAARLSSGGKSGSGSEQGAAAPTLAIVPRTAPSSRAKGLVCIVTRKRINNVTRAPRMAKALVDAGYEVVVVSLALPVPQLQEMCSEVQYLEVTLPPFVRNLTISCQNFRRKRRIYSQAREAGYQAALARGGLWALARRLGRAAKVSAQPVAQLSWRLFVVTPSALLLTKPSQRFAQRWRELVVQDAVGIAREIAVLQNQRWATHSFANEADKATRDRRFDIVQAYDNYALVAAARLAARDGAKLIYDAVELTSHRVDLDPNPVERVRERAERSEETRIIRKSDAVVTVSDGLADQYARRYHRPRPVVVRNCRYFWPYELDGRLRADAGVGPEVRVVVWCGSLYPQQGIELLIKALPHLAPHIHVAIIGFFQPFWKSYVQEVLPALASSLGVADRVRLLPAREPNDIVPYISGADLGVIPRSRGHLNNFVSMPNKFLEMVMARLPIAVSQLGDMVDLINKYDMGGVFDERDPADIAAVIERMIEPTIYARLKANVMKAAETLKWEEESLPYVDLMGSLMPTRRIAGESEPVGRKAPAPPDRSAERLGLIAEVRAILRIARVTKRTAVPEDVPAAGRDAAAAPAIAPHPALPSHGKGVVCIVTRKRINNVTRAPRMAKALMDAGYEVVVVSWARPVPQLEEMCPGAQYLEARPGALLRELAKRCEAFRQKQKNNRERREAGDQAVLAKGGLRAVARRLGRAARAPVRAVAWLSWRLFVATPSALLLKKPSQRFAQKWRELALQDAVGVASEFAAVQNQRWLTHGFAEAADKITRGRRFDVVQAYDNYALVAAATLAARDGAKLIYDAVELTSHRLALDLSFLERKRERAERREETRIVRRAEGMIAIGGGLADWYARQHRRPRPVIVRNCRYFWPYEVDGRLRADAGVGPEARLLVWIGSIYPQQGIEVLIRMLPHLAPHIHAAIIGFFQPRWQSYVQETLPALAASLGVADRVHILPEREPNDIVPYISGADIGVIPAWGAQVNNLISLPNKFHEMVMARLPLASSRLGETVDMIKRYEIGGIFDELDLVRTAAIIEGMLEPATYARLKANVMKAAETLTWEKESSAYVELVGSLMPTQDRTAAVTGQQAPQPSRSAAAPSEAAPADTGSAGRRGAKGSSLAEENKSLRTTNEKLRASYFQAAEANQKLRDAIVGSQNVGQFYRDSTSVNHYLRFARYCYERAADIKAEAYLAHGVEALPAADAVAKAVGGRVYCDVIEMPSFAQRSVPYDLHPTSLSLLDRAFDGYLRDAAGLSTVGWALGNRIRHYGPKVTVIPNYRNREPLQRSNEIRDSCGLGPQERLLLASSTIASGLEPIIEALSLLPDHVHLATLGNIFRGYRGSVEAAAARLGVERRVHMLDPVPYDRLATVASGANIGVMAIDASLTHWQISLPNRLFDCIAAGLPIVTPDLPDISRIVVGRKIGVALAGSDARSWADAIVAALADQEALRANVLAASKALAWESLADSLHAAYDHPASITIIAFTDLIGHQRTIRMADTLAKRGVRVSVCFPHEGPAPPDAIPGARIVLTPRPLPAAPAAKAASSPDPAAAAADVAPALANGAGPSLERLKKEVVELRYKARRYDEVKQQLPNWRAKAARYDRLKGKGGGTHLVSLRRALRLLPANRNEKRDEQKAAPL